MSEYAGNFDIPQSEIAAAAVSVGTVEKVIPLPANIQSWSLHINPIDGGSGNDLNFEMKYSYRDNEYHSVNPALLGTAIRNTDNVVTRSDSVGRIKVILTNGPARIDGDVEISLFINRN